MVTRSRWRVALVLAIPEKWLSWRWQFRIAMKRKMFLFMFVLAGFLPLGLSAQNGQSTKSMQEILMSHRWYPDIYDEEDKEISFFTYTKTLEIDSVTTEEGDLEVYIATYYLSDTLDKVFDKNKVEKATSGTYMILNRSHDSDVLETFIYKLIEVSDKKLVIQHLTPGWTSYGHINTCYPTPPKRESVD